MDHAPMLLVALTLAWLAGRWHRSLAPGLQALRILRAAGLTRVLETQGSVQPPLEGVGSRSGRLGPRLASGSRASLAPISASNLMSSLVAAVRRGVPRTAGLGFPGTADPGAPGAARLGSTPGAAGLGRRARAGTPGGAGPDPLRPAPASVRLELGYATPLPALRAHVRSVLARHPLWDGGHSAMQVVDATPATVVVRVCASVTTGADARRLEADLYEAVLLFLTRHYPESLDDDAPGRQAPGVPRGVLDR